MRDAFISTLLKHARENSRIILVTGDLGFKVFDEYRESLPNQFLNAGIAEQNMIGIAAGLAFEGWIPVVYSIANFASLRCLEQIRNDVCYHNLNVKIVSIGAGFSYGQLGASHHAIEDVSCLRGIPNLTILNPGTDLEAIGCTAEMLSSKDPAYLRVDREGAEDERKDLPFMIGKGRRLKEGIDVTILASGGIVSEVMEAASGLEQTGVSVRVVSFPSIVPIDFDEIKKACVETRLVVTVEEHTLAGGFGGLVTEVFSDSNIFPTNFMRIGIPRVFSEIVGDQKYLRKEFALDAQHIVEKIKSSLSISVR